MRLFFSISDLPTNNNIVKPVTCCLNYFTLESKIIKQWNARHTSQICDTYNIFPLTYDINYVAKKFGKKRNAFTLFFLYRVFQLLY